MQIKKKTPTEKWFYLSGSVQNGPLSLAQLKATAVAGHLPQEADVWRADIPVRVPAGCLPWLFPAGNQGAFDPDAVLPPEPVLTCTNCGGHFTHSAALYVARDARLPPDPLLHPGEPYRFMPSRFTPDGQAIDPGGMLTDETACPACHSSLTQPPRPLPAMAAVTVGNAAAVRTLAGTRPAATVVGGEHLPPALSTVEGIRQLIADLRGLLSRQVSSRTSGDQLARQYAELCRVVTVRLDLCARLMAAELRDEAVRQANTPPQLSEICTLLTFPELDDWRQLCARNRWSMPERVDAASAQAIEKTERSPAAIETTMRVLRRAVTARRYDICVRMFHTLMLMDTENIRWKEDATAFETRRQRELIEASQNAIETRDLPTLLKLMGELTGPWVSPPDKLILAPLISALQCLRTADAITDGRAIAARFAAACQSRNFASAATAANDYEALLQSGIFTPDETTRIDWDTGQTWYRQTCAQNEAAARMADDIAALENELAKPEPAPALHAMLAALIKTGTPIEAGLRQRAETAIAKRLRRERNQRLRHIIIRVFLVVLGLAAVALVVGQIAYTRQLRVWKTQLTPTLDTSDTLRFDQALNQLQRNSGLLLRKRLIGSPTIATLRQRRDELVILQRQSSQNFASMSADLQAIEADSFADPQMHVPDLLVRSRKPPLPRDRQIWLDAYEARWRTNQTQRLILLMSALPNLAAVSSVFTSQPFEHATQDVIRLTQQVEAGRLLVGADGPQRNRLEPYVETAKLLSEGLTNRMIALDSMDRATTLATYFDAMARYASRFETDWLSKSFDGVLQGRALTLVAINPTQDFLRQRNAIATADIWMKTRHTISDLHNIRTLVDLRWIKRKGLDDIALLQGNEKEEPNLKGQWAPVYMPTAMGIQPEFQRAMVLDSVPWGRGLAETPSKAFKHTEIVRDLLDRVTSFTRPEDGESYLEDLFRRVAAMPVWKGQGLPNDGELLNVCFKIQFLSFFAEQMTYISPFPEWQEILSALKSVDDPEVSWVCFRATRTRDVDRRGTEALAAIFGAGGPAQRLNVRRAAQQLTARAPLIWAGQVDRANTNLLIWQKGVAAPDTAASVNFETRAGKSFPYLQILATGPSNRLPGQPVLAWADGATITRRLRELAALLPNVPPATLPASLPEWFPRP